MTSSSSGSCKTCKCADKKPAVSVNVSEGIVTSHEVQWYDPRDPTTPAPRGVTLNLLTFAGIQVKGIWSDDGAFIAWAPMLKIPAWARDLVDQHYTRYYS